MFGTIEIPQEYAIRHHIGLIYPSDPIEHHHLYVYHKLNLRRFVSNLITCLAKAGLNPLFYNTTIS